MVFANETNETRRDLLEMAIRRAQSAGERVLFSFTERIHPPCSLTALFARAGQAYKGSRFFWSEPYSDRSFAAFGAACELACGDGADRYSRVEEGWERILAHAVFHGAEQGGQTGPMLVGGFSFDSLKSGGDTWRDFPDTRFVVPQFVISRRDGKAWLTGSRMIHPASDPEIEWERCEEDWRRMRQMVDDVRGGFEDVVDGEDGRRTAPQPVTMTEYHKEEWLAAVEQGVQAVRSNRFDKVVLARKCMLEQERPFPLRQVLETLREQQPGTFVFAIESGESCFVGATPERLIKREDDRFITLSLAGTAPRGATPEEDERIGQFLLTDDKNRIEHDLAVQMIAGVMERICEEVDVPDGPILFKLKDVQHLQTPIQGTAREGASLLQAVEWLHPTPALGGMPKEAALEFIRQVEPLERGWYAAPIGWMNGRREGEFVAGIRSALVRGQRAVLFAGCGIVGDSVPEDEYEETEFKFRPMIAALTGSRQMRLSERVEAK